LASGRVERLIERQEFALMFRWFVGLGHRDAVWDQSTFSQNRHRLLTGDAAAQFLSAVMGPAKDEAVPVERTLQRPWHADKGVGFDEELPADGEFRPGRAAARRAQRGDGEPISLWVRTLVKPLGRHGRSRAFYSQPKSRTKYFDTS